MKIKNKRNYFAVVCLAAVLLTACKSGVPSTTEVREVAGYTMPECMIFVATERNRYQEVYTDQIWNVNLKERGVTFREYLLGEVKSFLRELKMMNLLAEEQGIGLTGAEEEKLDEVSQAYYSGLTEGDKAYMGVTQEDVRNMYEEYYIANKLVDELTKDVNLEISDSEAKMISVQQIELSEREKADEVYQQVIAEGADFTAIARSQSENQKISRIVGRGENPGSFEDAAFALVTGEISPVVEFDGKYYILKCISDFEEEATLERKSRLSLQRKNQAFRQIYDQFAAGRQITMDEEAWNTMLFTDEENTTTTNFFSLYKEYFIP